MGNTLPSNTVAYANIAQRHGVAIQGVIVQNSKVCPFASAQAAGDIRHANGVCCVNGDGLQRLLLSQFLRSTHDLAPMVHAVHRHPYVVSGSAGAMVKSECTVVLIPAAKQLANARHLASTLIADARFCVAVGKLMQVVDVGRHLSSQGLDSPNLLRRAEAKVLEGKAVIKRGFSSCIFCRISSVSSKPRSPVTCT